MSTIDRIRYYDGEFLRAFDYSDEQAYHVEMRRRINRYLHVCGIVRGLTLSSDTQGGVTEVSILPGMAIDAYGREIYLFAPYTLGDDDVTNNRITQAGTYDVWLRYQKAPSTPPSSGYGNCNQANQYTRWEETYSVVLLPNPSNPFSPPGFADADGDDPSQDKVGVLLGTVYVDPTSATETFSSPLFDSKRCVLLGLIAQSIQAPPPLDAAQGTPPFDFKNQNSALNPPVSLDIQPNIFAEQNLIVGPDFDLNKTALGAAITPKPAFATGPGSAKLAGDLIVKGNIYSFVPSSSGNPQWLGLSAYVQQLVQQGLPDISSASQPVVAASAGVYSASGFSGTATIPVSMNRLTQFSSQQVIAFFSQVEMATKTDLGSLAGTDQIQFQITGQPVFAFSAGTSGNVSVSWQAQPAISTTKCAIDNFTLTCLVILYP